MASYLGKLFKALIDLITCGSTILPSLKDASANLITGVLQNNIYNVANNQVVIDGKLNSTAKKLYDDFNWDDYLNRVGSTQSYNLNFSLLFLKVINQDMILKIYTNFLEHTFYELKINNT